MLKTDPCRPGDNRNGVLCKTADVLHQWSPLAENSLNLAITFHKCSGSASQKLVCVCFETPLHDCLCKFLKEFFYKNFFAKHVPKEQDFFLMPALLGSTLFV